MPTSVEYLDQFSQLMAKRKVDRAVRRLYAYEFTQKNVATLHALGKIFPQYELVMGRFSAAGADLSQRVIDNARDNLSKAMIAGLTELRPNEGATWYDDHQFERMLYEIEPSILNLKHRELLINLRNQMRSSWQAKLQMLSLEEQVVANKKIDDEIARQEKNHQQVSTLLHKMAGQQQNVAEQLKVIQQLQCQQQGNSQVQFHEIQSKLSALGIHLDEKTLALMSGNKAILQKVDAAVEFLQQKNQHEQQMANKQGLLDGFAFLGALGEFTQIPVLSKTAKIGSELVNLHSAVTQFKQLQGLAQLSMMALAGTACLNIFAAFMGSGPDVSLQLLQRIAEQIQELHERFDGVHQHIHQLEQTMLLCFQAMQYQLAPVSIKLDSIQQQLQHIAELLTEGFQDVLLDDLKVNLYMVNNITQGIQALPEKPDTDKMMATLAFWIQEKSAHSQFICGALMNRQSQHKLPAKLQLEALRRLSDSPMLLSLLINRAAKSTVVPNLAIWQEAVSAYLRLREKCRLRGGQQYDADNVQLNEMQTQAQTLLNIVTEWSSDSTVIESMANENLAACESLVKEARDLAAKNLSLYQQLYTDEALLLQALKLDVADIVHQPNLVHSRTAVCSASYLHPSMKYKGNREHFNKTISQYQSEFGVSGVWCLSQIQSAAGPLFSNALLLAHQLGLAEISIDRQLIVGGIAERIKNARERNQSTPAAVAEAESYMAITVKFANETYQCSHSYEHNLLGYFNTANIQTNPRSILPADKKMLSFTDASGLLRFASCINPTVIHRVNQRATEIVSQALNQEKINYSQKLQTQCLSSDSAFYQAYLTLTTLAVSQRFHHCAVSANVDKALPHFQSVESTLTRAECANDVELLELIHKTVPELMQQLKVSTTQFNVSIRNFSLLSILQERTRQLLAVSELATSYASGSDLAQSSVRGQSFFTSTTSTTVPIDDDATAQAGSWLKS